MEELEQKLAAAYERYQVAPEQQASIQTFLNPLKLKHQPSYIHSLNVGILAANIGDYIHLDGRALLYAGLLHDIGKALTDLETLTKTVGFGPKDMEEMHRHPEDSYRFLRGIHDFSAEIVLRHHYFQEQGYPEDLPPYGVPFSKATAVSIDFYALVLSLADFYDAAKNRINDKHGEKRALTKTEVKDLMFTKHPHFKSLIGNLYREGILEG